MKKVKAYILKPYEIRPTMCRLRLLWLLRNYLYMEWRYYRVESQDEFRIWKSRIVRLNESMSEYYLVLSSFLNDIKDTSLTTPNKQ